MNFRLNVRFHSIGTQTLMLTCTFMFPLMIIYPYQLCEMLQSMTFSSTRLCLFSQVDNGLTYRLIKVKSMRQEKFGGSGL